MKASIRSLIFMIVLLFGWTNAFGQSAAQDINICFYGEHEFVGNDIIGYKWEEKEFGSFDSPNRIAFDMESKTMILVVDSIETMKLSFVGSTADKENKLYLIYSSKNQSGVLVFIFFNPSTFATDPQVERIEIHRKNQQLKQSFFMCP
jgi:hypothetical protein